MQILDPFIEIFDVSHTSSRHGSNARIAAWVNDDPTTVAVAAILLGYLMLGEKSSAREIKSLAHW